MKRGIAALVAVAALSVGLSACGGSSSTSSSPVSSSTPTVVHSPNKTAPQNPNKKEFDLKTLVGQKWSDASAKLTANEWMPTDYVIKTDDGKMVFAKSNWTVTAISDDPKPIISLRHDTSTPQPSSATPADPRKSALEQKLSPAAALGACRQYGKRQYPYGFKTHDILGVIQDFTPKDDNTWFYKATADVTNQYGAKAKGLTYECTVTGTTEAPQVIGFNVY